MKKGRITSQLVLFTTFMVVLKYTIRKILVIYNIIYITPGRIRLVLKAFAVARYLSSNQRLSVIIGNGS